MVKDGNNYIFIVEYFSYYCLIMYKIVWNYILEICDIGGFWDGIGLRG